MTVNQLRHRRSMLMTIMALLMFLIPGLVAAQPRQPDNDADLVERTVLELSRLQQRGNGNELYDWLSDLARERIPRASFAQWVDEAADFQATADPEIETITFGDWLWPVTGITFPNVATVVAHQPGTRLGESVSEEVTYHLLNEGTGWRWLFGESVANINAVANLSDTTLSYASEFASEPYQSIDIFWATIFADVGGEYAPVLDVVAVETAPFTTGCGTESDIGAAGIYLCLLDRTIYYSPALRTSVVADFGEIGWQTIIAHEWSHQIQTQLGIIYAGDPELEDGAYILELETQADCMTGIYMQAQFGEDAIARSDLQETRRVLATYGDFEEENWDDTVAHGSGQQRVASFNIGYRNGFVGCGLDLDDWRTA